MGQCAKGFKCKFSHDLNVQRKGEKIDIYSDKRDEGDFQLNTQFFCFCFFCVKCIFQLLYDFDLVGACLFKTPWRIGIKRHLRRWLSRRRTSITRINQLRLWVQLLFFFQYNVNGSKVVLGILDFMHVYVWTYVRVCVYCVDCRQI